MKYKATILKLLIVIVILMLIFGLALMGNAGVQTEKSTEVSQKSDVSWANFIGYRLTFSDVIFIIISLIAAILIGTLILIGIVKWKWSLIILVILGTAVILLLMAPNPNYEAETQGLGLNVNPVNPKEEIPEEAPKKEENETNNVNKFDRNNNKGDGTIITEDIDKNEEPKNISGLYIIIAVVSIVLLGLAFLLRTFWNTSKERKEDLISKKEAKEFRYKINLTIDKLKKMENPREAIILSYSIFLSGLSNLRFNKPPSDTPFEFAKKVLSYLDVDESDINTLISNFENARYSHNEIYESERNIAIQSLINIDKAIKEKFLQKKAKESVKKESINAVS